jgi:hypothetical protein
MYTFQQGHPSSPQNIVVVVLVVIAVVRSQHVEDFASELLVAALRSQLSIEPLDFIL